MQFKRELVRMLAALAVSGLLAGCSTPVGVRIADPREVERHLTRSALTDEQPSNFSQNALRRYDLMREYAEEPDSALAKLHTAAIADGLPANTLFALAELSFLRAHQTRQQAGYATALIYAYALLFPEQEHAALGPLDPRERIAAALYNRALTFAFRRTPKGKIVFSESAELVLELPFGHLTMTRAADMLQLNGVRFHDLQPTAEIEVKGLRNRYRRPGIGAPLGARMEALPGQVPVVPIDPLLEAPLTAFLRIESPLEGLRSGDLHARLELFASFESETVEIGGHAIPLEAEPTAALAASLADADFWSQEIKNFLGAALGARTDSSLGAMDPYSKGRMPVVFVHGTASSSARWADMVNDLLAEERLRDRYEFWFFKYDSGNPIVYSAYELRNQLAQAIDRADPSGSDPCARDAVVLGHSQGGLLTKMTAIDSGDAFWKNVSDEPFETMQLEPDDRELLRNLVFVKPLPFVSEVIFLATPHGGSYLAGPQFVRRIAAYFIRLPSGLMRLQGNLNKVAASTDSGIAGTRIPNSIDNMSPGNAFLEALAAIPVHAGVAAHSIISVDTDAPLDRAGDGVVKYRSAHIEGVESELIVRSPHSGMQAMPSTVEEVRRILLAHSERSACPMQAD